MKSHRFVYRTWHAVVPAWIPVLMLCSIASLWLGPTAGAAAVDASSPKAAVKSLYAAVAKGDAGAVKQLLFVEGDPSQQFAGAYGALMLAGKHLGDAARQKFPGTTDAFAQGGVLPEDAQKIDGATVTMEGDSAATVKVNDREPPTKLKRIDGAWRIVVGSGNEGAASAEQRQKQLSLLKDLADAMNQSGDDIAAGKFDSANEAQTAVKERLGAVLGKALQPEPSSQPSTQPR